jgi:hypothetical protein
MLDKLNKMSRTPACNCGRRVISANRSLLTFSSARTGLRETAAKTRVSKGLQTAGQVLPEYGHHRELAGYALSKVAVVPELWKVGFEGPKQWRLL